MESSLRLDISLRSGRDGADVKGYFRGKVYSRDKEEVFTCICM